MIFTLPLALSLAGRGNQRIPTPAHFLFKRKLLEGKGQITGRVRVLLIPNDMHLLN
jgi:hypothetical protein